MAWFFEDEASDYADAVLAAIAASQALVPEHWALEVSNAIIVGERRGRTDQASATRFLTLLGSLPIVADPEMYRRAFTDILAVARLRELTSYDAAYLELAARQSAALATLDKPLRKAARRAGVAIFEPTVPKN